MEQTAAVHFARSARRLGCAARAAGLVVPAFRSPPRRREALRTIRKLPGGAVVSVHISGRSPHEVEVDMVEGVLAANALRGEAAIRVRTALLGALAAAHQGEAA